MIFILHYFLFNAGLPAILLLITLFLQTYSDANMSEIGSLLMALPFVSILIKPLCCALADRHQAHKAYLMVALAFVALGYGALTIAPFFPQLVRDHGRLVWCIDVVGVVIGYSAFGVVWSLGDALAVNYAQFNGVTWGSYRVWGVVAWGLGGILIGQINETPQLPKYVPAMLIMVGAVLLEILLLAFWPSSDFTMNGATHPSSAAAAEVQASKEPRELEENPRGPGNRSPTGTLGGSMRTDPRMIGALASMYMGTLGGSLRSSLKLAAATRRAGLDVILNQQFHADLKPAAGAEGASVAVLSEIIGASAAAGVPGAQAAANCGPKHDTAGRSTLRRARLALGRMDSLSAASGHMIANELAASPAPTYTDDTAIRKCEQCQVAVEGANLSCQMSLDKAGARCLANGLATGAELKGPLADGSALSCKQCDLSLVAADSAKRALTEGLKSGALEQPQPVVAAKDLQLLLLKLIIRRDRTIWKYLVLFTIIGAVFTCHLSYFILYIEQLCRATQSDFSHVTGGMMAAQSLSEIFSFIVLAPYFVPLVGRAGALLACLVMYAARFGYYAAYLEHTSPFTGIPFELVHGTAYGIIYTLITDIACECVNQVDLYFPELIQRGLVDHSVEPEKLKLQLRATMQGLFSGAFDGLGNGIGALFGGLFLDSYSFTSLWLACFYVCIATLIIYPLTEWRSLFKSNPARVPSERKTSHF